MVTTTTNPVEQNSRNSSKHVIFVSNRGPLEHYFDQAGQIRARTAGGGVAVALASAAHGEKVSWIAGACSDADRVVAQTPGRVAIGVQSSLRLLALPESAAHPFYNSFCNPLLWFIQHGLGAELKLPATQPDAHDSWLTGYLPVNRLFADAVISEIDRFGSQARVMLHDYHLYIAPRLIRRARPDALLQQFIHIPWPEPSQWGMLPRWMVREICKDLLANDSLAFQTEESVRNFVATCEAYLLLGSGPNVRRLSYEGHTTHVWSNPISVDPAELASVRESVESAEKLPIVKAATGVKTIVRVDRLDPSKNIHRGFQAYELLLRRRPDLRGRVKFLAFLVPSRRGIPEYDEYAEGVFSLVDSINSRFGAADWTPIRIFYEQDRPQAMAGLALYDVLLVNSVADGMNLVSKEGPLVNQRDGVLCLSKTAGSFEQLGQSAIGFEPLNVDETARALEMALDLVPEVRSTMAAMSRSAIESHQLSDWLRHLLQDLELAAWRAGKQVSHGLAT